MTSADIIFVASTGLALGLISLFDLPSLIKTFENGLSERENFSIDLIVIFAVFVFIVVPVCLGARSFPDILSHAGNEVGQTTGWAPEHAKENTFVFLLSYCLGYMLQFFVLRKLAVRFYNYLETQIGEEQEQDFRYNSKRQTFNTKYSEHIFEQEQREKAQKNADNTWHKEQAVPAPECNEKVEKLSIFGLMPSANLAELKKSYRRMAKLHHPDRNRDNQAKAQVKMAELNVAYEWLEANW